MAASILLDSMAACVIALSFASIADGNLEVKLPTIWTDGKVEVGRDREGKKAIERTREEKGTEERRGRCAKK